MFKMLVMIHCGLASKKKKKNMTPSYLDHRSSRRFPTSHGGTPSSGQAIAGCHGKSQSNSWMMRGSPISGNLHTNYTYTNDILDMASNYQ